MNVPCLYDGVGDRPDKAGEPPPSPVTPHEKEAVGEVTINDGVDVTKIEERPGVTSGHRVGLIPRDHLGNRFWVCVEFDILNTFVSVMCQCVNNCAEMEIYRCERPLQETFLKIHM